MTNREYIIELFEKYGLDKSANVEVYKYYEDFVDQKLISSDIEKESWKRTVRNVRMQLVKDSYFVEKEDIHDVIDHNISLLKKNQRLQDLNRIERKSTRESNRVENALEELNKELIKVLSENSFKLPKIKPVAYKKSEKVLIVSLADIHAGENIDLPNNKYNYEILGKRLKKYSETIKDFGKFYKVKSIVIMNSGDSINNDILLDKILANADNRSKVLFILTYILSQFINDLAENFKIHYNGIIGNESRIMATKITPTENYLIDHNYDIVLLNMLKILYKDSNNVIIHNTGIDEAVIDIYGHNFLLLHGHTFNSESEKDVDKIIRNKAKEGILIDFLICGHIHETYIKNYIFRSGSLAGENSYSKSKNYSSIASQNIIIVDQTNVIPIPINLQNTDDIKEGYKFPRNIEEYNSMFDKKSRKTTTVLKIVI